MHTKSKHLTCVADAFHLYLERSRRQARVHADMRLVIVIFVNFRLKSALYQDQQGVLHPDIHTPFKSRLEAIKKLSSYHVCYDPGQTPSEVKKCE